MDIGVVTSAWGSYGKYLPEWASSILGQSAKPSMITIVDAGTATTEAEEVLCSGDVPWQIIRIPHTGMGAARNAAVGYTNTEWVMHLDADDVLLPHALEDIAQIHQDADVVSLGMSVNGREVTFPHTSNEHVRAGGIGCFSCAAYRKYLWERRPYITANDWVDSALWVGFAHEGARFVATERAGAVYRKHDNSFSRQLSDEDRIKAGEQHRLLCENPDLRL